MANNRNNEIYVFKEVDKGTVNVSSAKTRTASVVVAPSKSRARSTVVVSTKQRLGVAAPRKQFNYIYVPAFSFAHTWLGASYLLKRYFYTVPTPISILHWPAFAAGQRYLLVVGTGTTRYKLWKDVGEQLFVPLYNRELLPATFFIEVWSINEVGTAENLSPVLFDISRLAPPSNYCGNTTNKDDTLTRTDCDDPIYPFSGVDFSDGDYFVVDACGNVTVVDFTGGFLLTEEGEYVTQEDGGRIKRE